MRFILYYMCSFETYTMGTITTIIILQSIQSGQDLLFALCAVTFVLNLSIFYFVASSYLN